jgi:hypothetical protein
LCLSMKKGVETTLGRARASQRPTCNKITWSARAAQRRPEALADMHHKIQVLCTHQVMPQAGPEVLEDATSDHRPVVAKMEANHNNRANVQNIVRRNDKAIVRGELEAALRLWPWDAVHSLKAVEEVHTYVLKGITAALDLIASAKAIKVRRGSTCHLIRSKMSVVRGT